MEEHQILIGGIVFIIIIIQTLIGINTFTLISKYKSIFKDIRFSTSKAYIPLSKINSGTEINCDDGSYKVLQENISEETVEITYISTNTLIDHPVLSQIIKSLNTYLVKNKGAVSDFMLVKDIVERNCDARQEEINVQIPMPLYLGLMGTVIGIIVGIGSIALGTGVNKGFSAFINNPSESIGLLMGGVAIAMFASFLAFC